MPLLSIDPDTLEPLQAPLERLFRAHDAKLRRRIASAFRTVGEDKRDEAVASTWLIAARCVSRLSFDSAGAWLFVVARHELLALLEAERRERAIEGDDLERALGAHEPDLATAMDNQREAARILSVLRPRERRMLVGRALGLTYEQLAEATGQTYTNVNRHITRGKARARQSAYETP